MFFLLLLLITLVAFVNIFYTRLGKDILSPPLVMATMFLGGTVITTLNVFEWKIDFQLLTYVIVALGIAVFAVPSFYFSQKYEKTELRISKQRLFKVSRLKMVIVIAIVVIIMGIYIFSIYQLMARVNYPSKNFQYFIKNVDRLGKGHTLNPIVLTLVKVIDGFAYVCLYMFINNVIIYESKRQADLLLIVPVVLFSAKALLSGGRLDILKIAIAALITTYILHKRKVGWHVNISPMYLKIFTIAVPVGVLGFYYSVSFAGRTLSRTIFQTVATYFGGPVQHLNQYVMAPIESSGIFAQETLLSLMNTISSLTKAFPKTPSVALEYRQLSVTKGNIYTFFRRPLHDFGFFGMLIFTLLVGILFAYIYYRFLKYSVNSVKNDLITIFYGYIAYWVFLASFEQYSFSIISVFTFANLIVMFFCAIFMFYVDTFISDTKEIKWFRTPYSVHEVSMKELVVMRREKTPKVRVYLKQRFLGMADLLWNDSHKAVREVSYKSTYSDVVVPLKEESINTWQRKEESINTWQRAELTSKKYECSTKNKGKSSFTSFWRGRQEQPVKRQEVVRKPIQEKTIQLEQRPLEKSTELLSRRKLRRGRVTKR